MGRSAHAVGKSNRAALKDLFSASCLPILIRLRRSRLGSGGFGIWATMRAMSDENASDTCHGGGAGSMIHRVAPLRSAVAGDAPARCSRQRPQSTCSCASGQTPAPRRLPPEAREGAERVRRNRCRQSRRSAQPLKRTGGCVCHRIGAAFGLAQGPGSTHLRLAVGLVANDDSRQTGTRRLHLRSLG